MSITVFDILWETAIGVAFKSVDEDFEWKCLVVVG